MRFSTKGRVCRHTTRPVSVEHAEGWTYLGYEGRDSCAGYAHVIRDTWDVEVSR